MSPFLFGLPWLWLTGCGIFPAAPGTWVTVDESTFDETDGSVDTFNDDETWPTLPPTAWEDCGTSANPCILEGTLLEDTTLQADRLYLLRGGVFVGDDVNETVLAIEPGTMILGDVKGRSYLAIRRHSKILAQGTADAPIVFTSSNEWGRNAGDWGGLVVNGNALCNEPSGECSRGTGLFGGSDDNDDSGVLSYVRVEFAGRTLNHDGIPLGQAGLSLHGVGAGTQIDHVQVHQTAYDGVDIVGGAADVRHLVASQIGGGGLIWSNGWRGTGQFIVTQSAPSIRYQVGIEGVNQSGNPDAEPRSNPTLRNVTLIGQPESAYGGPGLLLAFGTAADISCAVVQGSNLSCLGLYGAATFDQIPGQLAIRQTTFDCPTLVDLDESAPLEAEPLAFILGHISGNDDGPSGVADPYPETSPDFRWPNNLCPDNAPPGFEQARFRGAVGPQDWTAGWTAYDLD